MESGARLMEANTYQGLGTTALFDGGKLLEKQLKSIEAMKKAELVSAGPEAWKPYTTHYRQQAIVDFKQKMATALKQEQTSALVPLSQDHQAWLTSAALLNVFQFDFEQGNCRSGVNYTNAFTGCIEGAADRKETVDALVKWAKGDVTDRRNPRGARLTNGSSNAFLVSSQTARDLNAWRKTERRSWQSSLDWKRHGI